MANLGCSDIAPCSMIEQVQGYPPKEVFFRVAADMFADGKFNWGRVVALFYFACKLVLKVSRPLLPLPSPRPPGLTAASNWLLFAFLHFQSWTGHLHESARPHQDHHQLDDGIYPGTHPGLDPSPGGMGESRKVSGRGFLPARTPAAWLGFSPGGEEGRAWAAGAPAVLLGRAGIWNREGGGVSHPVQAASTTPCWSSVISSQGLKASPALQLSPHKLSWWCAAGCACCRRGP